MTGRKRSGSGSKRQLRGKVVQIYESLFKGETSVINGPTFWDEFFLLKPNISHLEGEINKITPEQLSNVKININLLFIKCIDVLSQEHNIRVVHSLQTLCGLVQSVYRKLTAESGLEITSILVDFDMVEEKMQQLFSCCNTFLSGMLIIIICSRICFVKS